MGNSQCFRIFPEFDSSYSCMCASIKLKKSISRGELWLFLNRDAVIIEKSQALFFLFWVNDPRSSDALAVLFNHFYFRVSLLVEADVLRCGISPHISGKAEVVGSDCNSIQTVFNKLSNESSVTISFDRFWSVQTTLKWPFRVEYLRFYSLFWIRRLIF